MSAIPFRWLGLDSSLAAFGWCCASLETSERVLGAGVFVTKKDDAAESTTADTARRMHDIGGHVLELFARFRPSLVAIESVAVIPGASAGVTMSRLGRVFGLVDGICLTKGVRLVEVNSMTLKHFATGDRRAEKEHVLRAMLSRWPALTEHVEEVPKTARDNVTDAAALAAFVENTARGMHASSWRGEEVRA